MKGAIRHKSDMMKPAPPKEKKVRQTARKKDCDLVATQATVLQETETTGKKLRFLFVMIGTLLPGSQSSIFLKLLKEAKKNKLTLFIIGTW
jgi:hypothetical protein